MRVLLRQVGLPRPARLARGAGAKAVARTTKFTARPPASGWAHPLAHRPPPAGGSPIRRPHLAGGLGDRRRLIFTHHGEHSDGEEEGRPTQIQLRRLFVQAAVPMVGFGFMDNSVMIFMGDLIDNSLGVTLGLSTLTAAGIGQIFSDVSGVCFGGTVELLCTRLGLPSAALSPSQARMKISKLYSTLGAACGVVVGCLLGMSSLLFHDKSKTEELKHQAEFSKLLENENAEELRSYMEKLQSELRQAERALIHSERALVRLAPLVSNDDEAAVTERALRKINRLVSQDSRKKEEERKGLESAPLFSNEEAIKFLKKRISTAMPKEVREQMELASASDKRDKKDGQE